MLARQVSTGHDYIGKSAQKCYICREEGMVQKRAYKVTTCRVYKCTYYYIQISMDDQTV